MTPLREKMIELMTFRQLSPSTHTRYLNIVTRLSHYYHRSPEYITAAEAKHWLMETANRHHWAASTVHQAQMGLNLLYRQVLGQKQFALDIPLPKKPQKIPVLLTQEEVYAILHATHNLKHLTLLSVCYGCGLRVSELVNLTLAQIDSERLLLRIRQGKGKKDRQVPLSNSLLVLLRHYWQAWQPKDFLFVGRAKRAIDVSTAQRVFTRAKAEAGINKPGGIHSLRHAYATHQLEQGLPIHQLKQFLGHCDVSTTMRYLHWLPNTAVRASDLLGGFTADETIMNMQREVSDEHF